MWRMTDYIQTIAYYLTQGTYEKVLLRAYLQNTVDILKVVGPITQGEYDEETLREAKELALNIFRAKLELIYAEAGLCDPSVDWVESYC